MAFQILPSDQNGEFSLANATAIAIDKDKKNCPYAARWAVDHLSVSNSVVVLLHVRHKNHQYQVANSSDGEDDEELRQFFAPYRGYLCRKMIHLKEVVLDHIDVAKALLDFISENLIGSLVIGASTRNAFTRVNRRFRNQDLPSIIMKSAPDFCSIYVISKGKVLHMRPAQRPVSNTALPPKTQSAQQLIQAPRDHPEAEDGVRGQPGKGTTRNSGGSKLSAENTHEATARGGHHQDRGRNSTSKLSIDGIDVSFAGPSPRPSVSRDPMLDYSDFSGPLGSMDVTAQNLDFSISSTSQTDSNLQSVRDIGAEIRRLKLELKQTMNMYSTACKEALSARKKADELHQWKMEEARRFEAARLAEETALAIVEMEKAKCKAAMEAAEKAQRLAEMEAQKRMHAEMKAKRDAEEKNRALSALAKSDIRYRKYTIEEIEEATCSFSPAMKIGEGGYGPVFKGKLDHTPVAIKVLRPDAAQGKRQFQQEVEVLCSIRHPNMVLLLGACPDYGCLVYEYLENGSLEDRLLQRGNTPPISWRMRFKIAAEIATALLFLHQAKPEPLVHRDLKPANILLDRNYVTKISDVGLARLVPPSVADSVTQYHLTSAAGTFCYIDPEYQQTGQLTTRSDIYSLGIMLLQIITAKPAMGLAHQVGRAIERGNFEEILDQSVTDWPVEEALSFAKLALKCAELRKRDRPSLSQVVVPELNRLRDLGMKTEDFRSNVAVSSPGSSRRGRTHSPCRVPLPQ